MDDLVLSLSIVIALYCLLFACWLIREAIQNARYKREHEARESQGLYGDGEW